MIEQPFYTTQLQAGLGLIEETQTLLGQWQQGMSTQDLFNAALDSGEFPNVTARRLRNIVAECFAPRYLNPEPQPENGGYSSYPSGSIARGSNEVQLIIIAKRVLGLPD